MPLIPQSNLQNAAIIYLHQTRIRSQLIYSITLIAILLAIGALPFLYTTISVNGQGIMQSIVEKAELLAPANGRLISVNLTDNQKVKKDAILLTIDASLPNQQKNLISNHKSQLQQQLADAQKLIKVIGQPKKMFRQTYDDNLLLSTGLYAASLQQYTEALQNAGNAKEQAFKIYQRYKTLYDKKVVTTAEFEQYQSITTRHYQIMKW